MKRKMYLSMLFLSVTSMALALEQNDSLHKWRQVGKFTTKRDVEGGYLRYIGYVPKTALLAAAAHTQLLLVDTQTDEYTRAKTIKVSAIDPIWGLGINPSGNNIVSGCGTSSELHLKLWNVNRSYPPRDRDDIPHSPSRTFKSDTLPCTYGIAFHKSKPIFTSASSSRPGKILPVWDVGQERPIHRIKTEGASLSCVAFDDAHLLAVGNHEGSLQIWDLRNILHALYTIKSGEGLVQTVAFTNNNALAATNGTNSTIKIWDLNKPSPRPELLEGHTGTVSTVTFEPKSQLLASASSDNSVRLWDMATRKTVQKLDFNDWAYEAVFNPDGTELAVRVGNAEVFLFRKDTAHDDTQK